MSKGWDDRRARATASERQGPCAAVLSPTVSGDFREKGGSGQKMPLPPIPAATDKEIRICLSVTADISNGLDEVLWCSGPFLILTHSVRSLPPSQTCK